MGGNRDRPFMHTHSRRTGGDCSDVIICNHAECSGGQKPGGDVGCARPGRDGGPGRGRGRGRRMRMWMGWASSKWLLTAGCLARS